MVLVVSHPDAWSFALALPGNAASERARGHLADAELVVLAGSSTLIDAAVARRSGLMAPGLTYETSREGT